MTAQMLPLLTQALWETIYMVVVSSILAGLFGIVIGVILFTTNRGQILEQPTLNHILGLIVNAGRSVPFIILMIAIIPFTRILIGTSIGTTAAIVPLTLAAIPFFGRVVEGSLMEVDYGLVEAALAMGATPLQIIFRVLLPESASSLMLGFTLMVVNLVGYSAMAGTIGGGGLGDLAIRYGYQRFQAQYMIATVIIMIVMVQALQAGGEKWAAKLKK